MDQLLHFVFWEIAGNFLFCVGRVALRAISLGTVRLENPTRLQMFVVALFSLLVVFSSALLLINFVLGYMVK